MKTYTKEELEHQKMHDETNLFLEEKKKEIAEIMKLAQKQSRIWYATNIPIALFLLAATIWSIIIRNKVNSWEFMLIYLALFYGFNRQIEAIAKQVKTELGAKKAFNNFMKLEFPNERGDITFEQESETPKVN